MLSSREELWFEIPERMGFQNITPDVERVLARAGFAEGLVLVNAMHITASVFINDDEPGLHVDYGAGSRSSRRTPRSIAIATTAPVRTTATRTCKRQVMGREVVVAITEGALDFGPWEQIFYGEFDGRRRKRVLVKIIGE
jgi:secondary thiamine-phosphate synthase enzyme